MTERDLHIEDDWEFLQDMDTGEEVTERCQHRAELLSLR